MFKLYCSMWLMYFSLLMKDSMLEIVICFEALMLLIMIFNLIVNFTLSNLILVSVLAVCEAVVGVVLIIYYNNKKNKITLDSLHLFKF